MSKFCRHAKVRPPPNDSIFYCPIKKATVSFHKCLRCFEEANTDGKCNIMIKEIKKRNVKDKKPKGLKQQIKEKKKLMKIEWEKGREET